MKTQTHILMNRKSIEDADHMCTVSFTANGADTVQVTWTTATRSSGSNEEETMDRLAARAVWKKLIEGGEFAHAASVPGTLAENRRVVQNLPIYC